MKPLRFPEQNAKLQFQSTNFIIQGYNKQLMNSVLLLSCAKSHMLSASRPQPHLLHVSAVDRRQIWSMNKS